MLICRLFIIRRMYWCWDQLVEGHGRQSLSLKRQVWFERCFHLSSNMYIHAYTEPIKTGGKNQKTTKEELKLKTFSFQTRTQKDKNHPSISASPVWFPEHQHRSPSINYTEIKTMPKPLMIIRGSLYKWAEASCNNSLGSSRKWKNNTRRVEGVGEEKKLVISPET